ncbi:hypothetical protein [Bradyrhizobium sp. LHD-71]|uniref:hypothetical protein n=1 Tax=Bradyrhizobium sp. LHD-71 TaxID=3072141 RepID=UPI00280D4645|nr:hypothetical protein [Bradyrhizobium sp. LHD-71]MDQ8729724.1 hypothetical protein [Bradyrhizobium sp. LHD-71]
MSHLIHDESNYHALNRENDYRPYLIGGGASAEYRFGRFNRGRIRASARSAIRSIIHIFKVTHETLLASRMRCAERELQLRPHSARNLAIRRSIGR